LAVVGVIVVTLSQLHVNLLLANTTTTGGDTGAHFMMPAFLKSTLLPHLQLTGWDPAWYDGYPIYTFYFVLPDLMTALGSYLIPYDIAFKLATVAGSLSLPVAAWACGRLFRLRAPIPGVLAAATLPFLFDYAYTIYGGNLFSTLAGEYAYSLSLSLAIVFLGLFARGLRTGGLRTVTAVTLALCIISHIIPAAYALVGAGILTAFEMLPARWRPHDDGFGASSRLTGPPRTEAVRPWRSALWWAASTAGLGVLLSGWWLVPFEANGAYATSMGYANVTTYGQLFFPRGDLWAVGLAAVAVVVALARRSRFGLMLGLLAGLFAAGLVLDPLASLYNVRLLPLWFISIYLLAGWIFAVAVAALARAWRHYRLSRWVGSVAAPDARRSTRPGGSRWRPGAVAGPVLAFLGACLVVVPPFLVTDGTLSAAALPSAVNANQVSAWAQWNYSGYEGKASYPEYRALMSTMERVGQTYGCGRAMWEYNSDENRFGTPEALMLLPYWTGGCIDSMEGLLFESSTTTPYHFLNQAEMSLSPSEPMAALNDLDGRDAYGPLDVPLGVQHLQLLGVRYFMAASPAVKAQALADPSLTLVARTGPWKSDFAGELSTTWDIFEVRSAPLVTALTHEPAVLTNVGPEQKSWLGPSVAWYDDPAQWGVELAAGGPAAWPRVTAGAKPPAVAVPPTTISHITTSPSGSTLSFHVSTVGTPVLVKVSYFPNWQASGAQGPWRVTPNLMVVVPTSHDVTLTYGTSTSNRVGLAASVAAALALVVLAVWPWWRRRHRPRHHRPAV
jgi:hypothetical protein